jgi:hypothetical protein
MGIGHFGLIVGEFLNKSQIFEFLMTTFLLEK